MLLSAQCYLLRQLLTRPSSLSVAKAAEVSEFLTAHVNPMFPSAPEQSLERCGSAQDGLRAICISNEPNLALTVHELLQRKV
jgi:hypothetical protein